MNSFKDILGYNKMAMNILADKWLPELLPFQSQISEVLRILSDEESRDLYCREICYCLLSNCLHKNYSTAMSGMMTYAQWNEYIAQAKSMNIINEIDTPERNKMMLSHCIAATFIMEQYCYHDKVSIHSDDICLDVGACLGDTSIWMLQNGAKETYAFEIDQTNIACMKKTFNKKSEYSKIHIVNNAVSQVDGKLYYVPNKGNLAGGKVYVERPNVSEYNEVDCVTLDSFCLKHNIKPSFVKMDIEGAELDAIKGSKNIFKMYRPRFAICIYHKWQHRWQIPLELKKICPNYEFYLKKSHPECETVLFGKPNTSYELVEFDHIA